MTLIFKKRHTKVLKSGMQVLMMLQLFFLLLRAEIIQGTFILHILELLTSSFQI